MTLCEAVIPDCAKRIVHTYHRDEGFIYLMLLPTATVEARWRTLANNPPRYDGRMASLLRYAPYVQHS